jgi:predicted permease
MENIILIIICLAIGLGLQHIKEIPRNLAESLNIFVIYVSVPALVLLKVPELNFSGDLLIPIIMPWLMLALAVVLILVLAKVFNWSRDVVGVLLLVIPLGNTSFLGFPLVKSFFGESALPYAVLYDQLGSFLALAIYGSIILAIYSNKEEKLSFVSVSKTVLKFPPFISFIVALIFSQYLTSSNVSTLLSPLAATLVPVIMVAVGFNLRFRLTKQEISPLIFGLSIKLLIMPLVAFLIIQTLGMNTLPAIVSVFEAGMAPMITAGALAVMAGLSPRLSAAMVGYGLLISLVTLPILYHLLS